MIAVFTLSISNMIQNKDQLLNCVIEAQNEWTPLSNPADVSEGESFLWVGKTRHLLNNVKSNQIRSVELKCSVSRPGVYNLNRFKILVKAAKEESEGQHYVSEFKIQDDILLHVRSSSGVDAEGNIDAQGISSLLFS